MSKNITKNLKTLKARATAANVLPMLKSNRELLAKAHENAAGGESQTDVENIGYAMRRIDEAIIALALVG